MEDCTICTTCMYDLSYVPALSALFFAVCVLRRSFSRFFSGYFFSPTGFMLIARGLSLVPAICVNFKAWFTHNKHFVVVPTAIAVFSFSFQFAGHTFRLRVVLCVTSGVYLFWVVLGGGKRQTKPGIGWDLAGVAYRGLTSSTSIHIRRFAPLFRQRSQL